MWLSEKTIFFSSKFENKTIFKEDLKDGLIYYETKVTLKQEKYDNFLFTEEGNMIKYDQNSNKFGNSFIRSFRFTI